jgi:L-seryl-tRNA(Ser) seleniumtransferase
MAASGSPLFEIGTTNRTHLADYAAAIEGGAGLILSVHRSNFVMTGYVSEPPPEEVIALARAHGVPVMLDLGSGALADTSGGGLPEELTVEHAVHMGFDVICFSGDKLLGGPQAGCLVGRQKAISALRAHPLARALRCDKLQLAGVVATLELYRRGEAERQVPIWRLLATDPQDIRARAEAWQKRIGAGEVVRADDAVGGGSLPEGRLAGFALALTSDHPDELLARLRAGSPPVVAHIHNDRVLLHPRTVLPDEDGLLTGCVLAALHDD